MEERKNKILLGVILFGCVIYCFAYQHPFFMMKHLSMLLLGTAFFLLYEKKRIGWALWIGIFLLGFWASQQLSRIPVFGNGIAAIIFWEVPGALLLKKYHDTGWQGYVLPGCFAIWTGLYSAIISIHTFYHQGFLLLIVELASAFYMNWLIKKKGNGVIRAFLQSSILFIIICLVTFVRARGLII